MEKVVLEKRTVQRWNGITRCAAKLGISRSQLSRVMHGLRLPGKDLERRMRRLGLVPGSAGPDKASWMM
jgi:transcriptional regulator with XRE-family HTH domain